MKKHGDPKGQETHTTLDYKKVLKIFVRVVRTGERHKNQEILDPVEIRRVKIKRVKDRLAREDLITDEELGMLLHACGDNLRDLHILPKYRTMTCKHSIANPFDLFSIL